MSWDTIVQGNAITVWPEEHFAQYPDGHTAPGDDTMSIGYFDIANGGGPDILVPNISTQAKSIVISIMPVDEGAGVEFARALQYFRHSTADNVAGARFWIMTNPAIGGDGFFDNTGIFRYWLLHPAWK